MTSCAHIDVTSTPSLTKAKLVALSTADSYKWLRLIEDRLGKQTPEDHTSSDYQLLGPIRQRQ
jgi:hypothetical protein